MNISTHYYIHFMKRFFVSKKIVGVGTSTILAVFLSLCALSCEKKEPIERDNVIHFMGVPIDGSKAKVVRGLKKQGFVRSKLYPSLLEGEFNGRDMLLHVLTHKDKVYSIALVDAMASNEVDIKIAYNTLFQQIQNNGKYIFIGGDGLISEDENVLHKMYFDEHRYASFFYALSSEELEELVGQYMAYIRDSYNEDELVKPSDKMQMDLKQIQGVLIDQKLQKKVTLGIVRDSDGFKIALFYNNVHNEPKGEAL